MRSHEVVVGHKESSEGHSSLERLEASSGSCVVLVGSIESFDELFECTILFTFGIKVLKTDDGLLADFWGIAWDLGVIRHDGIVIREQTIGDEV